MTIDSFDVPKDLEAVHTLPLLQLHYHHEVANALCADLERVADGLPGLPALSSLRRLLARVEILVDVRFRQIEGLIQRLPEPQRPDPAALSQLKAMHAMDADHAHDLAAALWDLALRRRDSGDAARIGYMLRCLFEGCRRAMAFQQALLREAASPQAG